MNEPQTFRSAFNGFNREDVVNHIAYMTTKHETLVSQLRSEADTLRTELTELKARLEENEQTEDRVPALEEALSARDQELASAREELDAANQLLNEQAEQMAALREQLEEAQEAAAKSSTIEKSASHWDELRAYRRAENVERQAHERVNQLYDSATEALRNAGKDLAAATDTFDTLAEKFRADLVALMENIDAGRNSLSAAADTLDGLRPEDIQ